MNRVLLVKIIIGILLIWGGFKLQKLLWPINSSITSNSTDTDAEK